MNENHENTSAETSDQQLLDLLRQREPLRMNDFITATAVTATAVRQRLRRLMKQGLISRTVVSGARGRPSHHYWLTEKARRQAGSNFADLAVTLWDEIRSVKEPEIRRGLLQRVARSLAEKYRGRVAGETLAARMNEVKDVFSERSVRLDVSAAGALPVLTVHECPYPELAERDRTICAVENMMFSELFEEKVHLAQCRLDGHSCCQFQTSAAAAGG